MGGVRLQMLAGLEKPAEQGAGLGLMICKMIIESHEGTIEAGAGPAGGTRFTITLPVETDQ